MVRLRVFRGVLKDFIGRTDASAWGRWIKTCCVLIELEDSIHGPSRLWMVSVHGGLLASAGKQTERDKGIRWMPWHQEAMKDVARCEKPWGAASRL